MSCGLGMFQSLLLPFDTNLAGAAAQSEASCVCELARLVCLHTQATHNMMQSLTYCHTG